MKKLLWILALPVLAAVIGFVAGARAGARVELCHFPAERLVGFWISVSANAVESHMARHGDLPAEAAFDLGQGACAIPDIIVR